jgi:diguanylate cyclase (GGDEF)-like protein/PAS domain S-box-containing protein
MPRVRSRILLLSLAGACAIGTLVAGTARVLSDEQTAVAWVAHTQGVLLRSAELELSLQTAISEGRGFFTTRDPADRYRYDAAALRVGRDIAALRDLTSPAPEQQRIIERLALLIEARLALLRRLSDIDPAAPPMSERSALWPVAVAQAREIAEGIASLRTLVTDELEVHEADAARARRITIGGIAVAGAVLSASTLLILSLLARQRRERQHLLDLGQLNIALEQRVAERTAELRTAHERMTLAADSGGIGIWDYDAAADQLLWDDRMHRHYGLRPGEAPKGRQSWLLRLHPDDRAAADQAVRAALEGSGTLDIEFRVVWDDGSIHDLKSFGRVIRDAAGRPLRMLGANFDITERRQLLTRLAEQHDLLEVTLQSIGDGVITADVAGKVSWLNPAAERMTGWRAEEAVGRPVAEVLRLHHGADRTAPYDPLGHPLGEGRIAGAANVVLISRQGQEFGIEDTASPIRDRHGRTVGVVLVIRDVTEQRRLAREMGYRATHDALTGLVNRAELETRLRAVFEKSCQDASPHALLLMDLDQFKLINDTCGHAVGDHLLQQVARMLLGVVRASDTVARLGGDEFAIILDHCDQAPAERLAQRICDAVEGFRLEHEERRLRVGVSIGLVPVDDRWASPDAILQAADRSCYAAKEAGRHRVHVWRDSDATMQARHGQTQWAARLEQALEDDLFVLFAQRISALSDTAEGVRAEVLLRLAEPDGTLVAPGAFLPAAERFHMASRIDRWVLSQVVGWMQSLADLDRIACLSVNLSGQSIGDPAFHRWALDMLRDAGDAVCRRLCVEITETAAVTSFADAGDFIAQVRGIGVAVALDDFGAGVSSFGYLKNLKVDFLKIDGQFIRDLATDPLDDAAVRCFADVARVVSITTVAEHVESEAVLERLRAIGIDQAQGFLLHMPAPIDQLLQPAYQSV